MASSIQSENTPDPIADLLIAYDELNNSFIDELDEEPSALEFMRYVAQNRPFVVRNGAGDWEAIECWDAAYLTEKLGDQGVNVAITPFG